MKVTERGVLLTAMAGFVGLAVAFALVGRELAGWVYPGDFLVWAVGFAVAGLLIQRAVPSHTIGRLFLWCGVFASMNLLSLQVGATFFSDLRADPGGYVEGTALWLVVFDVVFGSGFVWVPILVVAAIARFPDGRWLARWIKWVFWVSVPLQVLGSIGLPPIGGILVVVIFVTVVRSAWRSGPLQRRQMAWALIGIGLFLVIGVGSISPVVPGWLVMSGVVLVPAGFVVAITRYKLYEIDRIVSRTVTYVVVIGVLGAVYAGLVLALRSVVPVEGPLPVALSTLAVAFAFFPLMRRVQRVVDRRFFRSRYDAAGVVAAFADELRSTLDPVVAAGRAESVVSETFQAESVSVWLAEEPA